MHAAKPSNRSDVSDETKSAHLSCLARDDCVVSVGKNSACVGLGGGGVARGPNNDRGGSDRKTTVRAIWMYCGNRKFSF